MRRQRTTKYYLHKFKMREMNTRSMPVAFASDQHTFDLPHRSTQIGLAIECHVGTHVSNPTMGQTSPPRHHISNQDLYQSIPRRKTPPLFLAQYVLNSKSLTLGNQMLWFTSSKLKGVTLTHTCSYRTTPSHSRPGTPQTQGNAPQLAFFTDTWYLMWSKQN